MCKDGLITGNAADGFVLPTYEEYLSIAVGEKQLVGIEDYLRNKLDSSSYQYVKNIKVLPLISDPTKEDTDGDGLNDGEDPYKLQKNQYDRYDRESAVNYALEWYNGRNPEYREYSTDCANFVSQCLFNGYISMNDDWHCYYNGIKSFEDFMLGFLNTESERFLFTNDLKYVEDWNISPAWRLAKEQYEYFVDSTYRACVFEIETAQDVDAIVKSGIVKPGDLAYCSDDKFYHDDPYHATIISKVDRNDICYAAHTSEYDYRSMK